MGQLSAAMHQQRPGSQVTIDTYSGAASWDDGLFRIDTLAPNVDAMFIMAYDMSFSNMSGHAGPNAPINGWTYNDTLAINQYLTKAPASKIILGVPWYGYLFTTSSNATYAAASRAQAVSYHNGNVELTCGNKVSYGWDAQSQTPWAAWYSPRSNDPCGDNLGSWVELWYDNTQSLGIKYGLVNAKGIRGMGVWALGYDGGLPEMWSTLNTYFSCPASATVDATQATTEFSVSLSAGTCNVSYYDVQEYDVTNNAGWFTLPQVKGSATGFVAQGYPGNSYQFRARALSHPKNYARADARRGITDAGPSASISSARKSIFDFHIDCFIRAALRGQSALIFKATNRMGGELKRSTESKASSNSAPGGEAFELPVPFLTPWSRIS